jgi:hypothetical protein
MEWKLPLNETQYRKGQMPGQGVPKTDKKTFFKKTTKNYTASNNGYFSNYEHIILLACKKYGNIG